ncbi:hypothetical protein ACFP4F_17220 [Streptomyces ochraceiscleroticus]|uniref:Uncharacterized protein n=1 Tax=Streptomyces ochraceiscleroticus TaxID=47761 RepID=A0ABW1MKC9_9ACTN
MIDELGTTGEDREPRARTRTRHQGEGEVCRCAYVRCSKRLPATSVAMEDMLIFDQVRAVLAAGTLPVASAQRTQKGARTPQAAGNTVEFRAVAEDDEESGAVL